MENRDLIPIFEEAFFYLGIGPCMFSDEWIRVKKPNFPKFNQPILVQDGTIYCVARLDPKQGFVSFWDNSPLKGITHWQPLPL